MSAPATEAAFTPRPESFTFALSLAGRAAGEMTWQLSPDKSAWVVRAQTEFGGVLPDVRKIQTSRVHPRTFTSLGYSEGDGRRVSFESLIDRKAGLVTVRQGRDEASAPLVTDLHDPLSALLWLRAFQPQERVTLPLVGGHAFVRRLSDAEIGGVAALVFEMRPGRALVYVEQAAPHRLLGLVQPTDFGPIDATLQGERGERGRGRDNPKRRRAR